MPHPFYIEGVERPNYKTHAADASGLENTTVLSLKIDVSEKRTKHCLNTRKQDNPSSP